MKKKSLSLFSYCSCLIRSLFLLMHQKHIKSKNLHFLIIPTELYQSTKQHFPTLLQEIKHKIHSHTAVSWTNKDLWLSRFYILMRTSFRQKGDILHLGSRQEDYLKLNLSLYSIGKDKWNIPPYSLQDTI